MKRLANAVVPGLALFLLGGALQAQGFSSIHWKSTSQLTGGPQGDMTTESELWMKDKKVRVKTKAMGMDMNVVKSGDIVYQWQEGQNSGMKMSATMRRRGGSMEYVEKMEEIRTKGKKVGTETVEGHPCDIYEYTDTSGQHGEMKQKYWMARDLKNFPVKVVSDNGSMKITTLNHDIDLNASIPDSMLTPPDNVKFQDMTEMMKGMAPKS